MRSISSCINRHTLSLTHTHFYSLSFSHSYTRTHLLRSAAPLIVFFLDHFENIGLVPCLCVRHEQSSRFVKSKQSKSMYMCVYVYVYEWAYVYMRRYNSAHSTSVHGTHTHTQRTWAAPPVSVCRTLSHVAKNAPRGLRP
jgi:hypothetical protein